jgi:RNA polymerase sigma factor (TIGR02999 family)
MTPVTRILTSIEQCDARAAGELLPVVYQELRRLAVQMVSRERPGHTLQATALVHEAYLRLMGGEEVGGRWHSRAHFFAAAAEAMRRILIDAARRKQRLKHGGGRERLDFAAIDEHVELALPGPSDEVLALDEALERLAAIDPAKAEVVKLRYFAGLTLEEAAGTLGISPATADRYWAFARAWLYKEMRGSEKE